MMPLWALDRIGWVVVKSRLWAGRELLVLGKVAWDSESIAIISSSSLLWSVSHLSGYYGVELRKVNHTTWFRCPYCVWCDCHIGVK